MAHGCDATELLRRVRAVDDEHAQRILEIALDGAERHGAMAARASLRRTPRNEKLLRVAEANKVIAACAAYGRRFFWNKAENRIARFELDDRGAIWFRDDYTWNLIYVAWERGEWRGWSGGGTLRDLVRALRDYIRTGIPIKAQWFGPWPDWICDGDPWGYGADMELVRRTVTASMAVAIATRRGNRV